MVKNVHICFLRWLRSRVSKTSALVAFLACTTLAGPAFAIPSPELVIGSVSSLSQLLALLSAILGGGAIAAGARTNSIGGASRRANKMVVRFTGAMVLVFALSLGTNVYQFMDRNESARARLEATLIRPARNPGTNILDPTLKEISFNDQASHPLGITTQAAAKVLQARASGSKTHVFLDIRETAENEMGTIPGARHIRFPDLAMSRIDLKGKRAILFCHNGNRSSETCEKLAAQGIDCRFISGGIEKWIVEGKPFTNKKVRSLSDLRAIPPYPTQNVLLDTPKVRNLMDAEGAVFVDVRYPGEFNIQHLPDAINLPLRRTPTGDLHRRISQLPKKPIVAACYDRRGCFASQVLGLELTRAGHDFRGRYTLPWEYFVPAKRKSHIEAWLADAQLGLWQRSVNGVAALIGSIADHWGFLFAIVLAALVSRLLLLPVSLKAEKDQIVANAVSDEMRALKERMGHDPQRMTRAVRSFYRRHGLTPARNLLALAFLPLMAVTLSAVQLVATKQTRSLFWLTDLSEPDPSFLLPIVFGLLATLYLHDVVAKNRRQQGYVWLAGFPGLTVLAAMLSGAGNLYLIVSVLLLLLQRTFVVGRFGVIKGAAAKLKQSWRNWRSRGGIVPLAYVDQLTSCGNKSYRLAKLHSHGVAVPDGLVLTDAFLKRFDAFSHKNRRGTLDRLWRKMGAHQIAVRSSASAEDGETQSFAGVFESVLYVDRSRLGDAINRVVASFGSSRAGSYDAQSSSGSVLLQRMVDAEYAGVLFTRAPEAQGMMMVELVQGTADGLVAGSLAPETYQFGRYTHQPIGDEKAPVDLSGLIDIGRQAERLFGAPQDIEWTYKDGKFLIVQSRDITTLGIGHKKERARQQEWGVIFERAKGADPDEILFEQTEMSEVLPRPTPLSLSLMQSLWASGGSVDLACRRLGLSYPIEEDSPSRLVTIFDRLYIDKREESKHAVRLNRATVRRLKKDAAQIERNFLEMFLPNFCKEMHLLEVANFDQLPTDELFYLVERLRDDFVTNTHVEVEIINIAASFYLEQAKQLLMEAGLDPTDLLQCAPESGPARTIAHALRMPEDQRRKLLLAELGHRAVFDYELADPRYAEDPSALDVLCMPGSTALASDSSGRPSQTSGDLECLEPTLAEVVRSARRYQTLKEEAKHQSLRQFAVLRHATMALDRRVNLAGLSPFLTFDELKALQTQGAESFRSIAESRKEQMVLFKEMAPLPHSLTLFELEAASANTSSITKLHKGTLGGTRVSGSYEVVGRAQVISPADAEAGRPISGFEDGDIIVCSMVHPAWLPYVLRAGGVVCEVGGWLSHMAIVAREHDIAMIVGVHGLQSIPQGSLLRIHSSGEIELLASEERNSPIIVAAGILCNDTRKPYAVASGFHSARHRIDSHPLEDSSHRRPSDQGSRRNSHRL